MGKTSLHLLMLTGAASLVLFVNLGGPRLWDRDEPRNAACAREMLERGDWVVPTFNNELRVLKPAMKYWLMMSAYRMFGVNEFAARFWSAVFALASVWATYFLGRRLFNASAGLWSALILSTSLLFLGTGHFAKADAPLTFLSTLALLVYVYSVFKPSQQPLESYDTASSCTMSFPQSWPVAVLIYAVIGLAALAKGLPGLLLPAAVIGMFLLIVRLPESADQGDRPWWLRLLRLLRPFEPRHFLRVFWSMRPITALVVTLVVAAPWYVLVGIRTDGEFLRGFFLEHHFGRALQPMEHHSGPFLLYYIGTIAVGFFPWSVFLGALLVWLVAQFRQGHPRQAAHVFLACWVSVYVVIFSCAQTKLPNYIAPCFPALALLMGGFIQQWSAGVVEPSRFWIRSGLVLLGVIGAAVAIGMVIAARRVLPGAEHLGVMGLMLVIGAGAAFLLLQRQRVLAANITLVVAALAFEAILFDVGLVWVGNKQEHQVLCAAIRASSSDPHVGSFGSVEPSWVFYVKRPIQPLELTNEVPDECYDWKVRPIRAADFFGQDRDRFIITTDWEWEWLRPTLPADAQVLAQSPRFLRKGCWLLIGHGLDTASSRR